MKQHKNSFLKNRQSFSIRNLEKFQTVLQKIDCSCGPVHFQLEEYFTLVAFFIVHSMKYALKVYKTQANRYV